MRLRQVQEAAVASILFLVMTMPASQQEIKELEACRDGGNPSEASREGVAASAGTKLSTDGAGVHAVQRSSPSRSRSPRRTSAVASDLVSEALACLGELPPQVDRARCLFQKALAAEPENVETLDAFGALLCEEGEEELAVELLTRSVALRPDEGADKYLCLAQLASGEQALANYMKGSSLLQKVIDAAQETPAAESAVNVETIRRQLAKTQASIAELYMTDLCDLPEAESECEAALARGLEADADCLEVQATKAALRKVQGKLDEAKELALGCAKKVEQCFRDQNALCNGEEEVVTSNARDAFADEDVVQLCRVLIDLLQTNEARALLELLLEKNEEDIQVWCLLGFCHVVEKDAEGAKECVGHATKLCKKLGREAAVWKPTISDLLRRTKRLSRSASNGKSEAVDAPAGVTSPSKNSAPAPAT